MEGGVVTLVDAKWISMEKKLHPVIARIGKIYILNSRGASSSTIKYYIVFYAE